MARFRDRREAGERLAVRLEPWRADHPVVVALPRGGVPVAAEIARALGAPLDVMIVRKLGVPIQPELAMGAIGEGGARVLNDDVIRVARVTEREIDTVEVRERAEVARRARRYRERAPMLELGGRTVIVVDDGIATGSTARAALQIARANGACEWCWPLRSRPPMRSSSWPVKPTTSSCSRPRPRSSPSGRGTPTSRRPPTTRCAGCSRCRGVRRAHERRPVTTGKLTRVAPATVE